MKKTVIAVVICAVVIAIALIPVLSGSNDILKWERCSADLVKFGAEAVEAGAFTAEVDGQSYPVGAELLDTVLRRLNYGGSERQRTEHAPETAQRQMTLRLGDKCTVQLYDLDGKGNNTAVFMTAENRVYSWQLDGYKLFDWLLRDVTENA